MIPRFSVECAVWHPKVTAEAIESAVGLRRKIGWSSGEVHNNSTVPKQETYCRFSLGSYSQKQLNINLGQLLKPFEALEHISAFHKGRGVVVVYFANIDQAPDLHIHRSSLQSISRIRASVVFR